MDDDLSFTSKYIGDQTYLYYDEASPKTIAVWSEDIAGFDGNCVIRFERATFGGTTWESMSHYYEDMLASFAEYGFSWWSNDWWLMTEEYPQTKIIAECPSTAYAGYEHFNLELLRLFQKCQSKE